MEVVIDLMEAWEGLAPGLQEAKMPFHDVADPEHLAMLARVFNAHCERYGITSPNDRDTIAFQLINHFQRGVVDEDHLMMLLANEARLRHGGKG